MQRHEPRPESSVSNASGSNVSSVTVNVMTFTNRTADGDTVERERYSKERRERRDQCIIHEERILHTQHTLLKKA